MVVNSDLGQARLCLNVHVHCSMLYLKTLEIEAKAELLLIYLLTKWLAVSLSSRADRMSQSDYIPCAVVRITVILNNGIYFRY